MKFRLLLVFFFSYLVTPIRATSFECLHKVAYSSALCDRYKALPQDQKILWGSLVFGNYLVLLFEQMLGQHLELLDKKERHESFALLVPDIKLNNSTIIWFYQAIRFFSTKGVINKNAFEQIIDANIEFFVINRACLVLPTWQAIEEKFKELEKRGFLIADFFAQKLPRKDLVREAQHLFKVSQHLKNPKCGYASPIAIEPVEITLQIPEVEKYNTPTMTEKMNDFLYNYENRLLQAQGRLAGFIAQVSDNKKVCMVVRTLVMSGILYKVVS